MYRDSQYGLTIDLAGPDGNAFFLLGWAKENAITMTGKELTEKMTAGDYNHLLKVFEEEFGGAVRLINKPE
jgi:hypothetical protein